jgi:hypothetical protein
MEFQDKISKKCNLEHNDSISTYNGWGAQQNFNSFEVFHNFIHEVKPKRILEIGTSLGGFTCFLKYTCERLNLECDISTYDIVEKSWYNELTNMGIVVKIENVFNENYTKVDDEVINFINGEGVTIVLCDGGDKIKEFNILSEHIKIGDYILAHDYSYDREFFEKHINKKIWNWHEISEKDIENACLNNNLHDYNREIFQSVVWICKVKL